jgi:uncharacterized membrane protein
LIIGLLAGILLSIFIPYGAGFDEEAHLVRIFDMGNGNLIPNKPGSTALLEIYSLSYQRRYLQTPANDLFSPEKFLQNIDKSIVTDANTVSTYSPVVFAIEAVIARIAWLHFNLPLIPVVIVMRLVGLFIFLLLGYLAIRVIPAGKWVLTVLLLAPMALYQAATLNGDRFTIGASVFFIAAVLKVYAQKDKPISLKDSLLLALASILIGTAKSGTIILLPLLFLLVGRNFDSKKARFLLFASIFISIVYSIGWSFISVLGTTVSSTGKSRSSQIMLVLNNFPEFIHVYITGVIRILPKYYTDWVAEFGYWIGKVPWPIYVLFPVSLLLAYFCEEKNPNITRKGRLIILAIAVFCLGLMASVKFVWAFVPGQLYFGSQGRYFLPFAAVLFLAFAGWLSVSKNTRVAATAMCLILITATLAIYGYGIYRTYYTSCVYAVDASHPCVLPVYKNLDTANPAQIPLKVGTVIEQGFDPECGPIDAIDVRILSVQGEVTGIVKLSFFDPEHTLLATGELPVSRLKAGGVAHFTFDPVQVKGSNTYFFTLELSEGSSTTVVLMGDIRDDYGKGVLLVNGETTLTLRISSFNLNARQNRNNLVYPGRAQFCCIRADSFSLVKYLGNSKIRFLLSIKLSKQSESVHGENRME